MITVAERWDDKFTDKEGILLKQNIKHHAEQFDSELIKLLLNNKTTKAHFFDGFSGVRVAQSLVFCDLVGRLLLVFVWLNL